jgi:hypothetical protein
MADNIAQVRFAAEKKISQKLYITAIKVLDDKQVEVAGDRIIDIGGIRTAGQLHVVFEYVRAVRTEANPAGIYFTAKRLNQEPTSKSGASNG